MWSDKYYYLNIYKDENLNSTCSTKELRDFLVNIPELKQVNEYEFKNGKSFPFTQLLILKAKSVDNWSNLDTNPRVSNLVTIVSQKGENVDYEELKRVFIEIASFLNWKLVDEETDDGIENFMIWEPKNKTNTQKV